MNSCLLALPVELLDRIIEFAVVEDEAIEISVDNLRCSPKTRRYVRVLTPELPPLAMACKTLFKEVNSIFLAANVFIWNFPIEDPGHFWEYYSRELEILKNVLNKRADLIRHFYFTVEHMVRFQGAISRRNFEIRLHKSRDGTMSCEYYSLGGFNPIGMHNRCRDQCCACYLDEISEFGHRHGYNLLEVAEVFFEEVLYDTRYRTCDSCGLPKNEEYSD